MIRNLVVLVAVVVVIFVVRLALLGRQSESGVALAASESDPEQLEVCGTKPNCVSSTDSRPEFQIAAIPFSDSPEAALARAEAALTQSERTKITRKGPNYLRAEARSKLFGFVDDVEILVDAKANVIQLRSASRVGYSDLGVNRKRLEHLRAILAR